MQLRAPAPKTRAAFLPLAASTLTLPNFDESCFCNHDHSAASPAVASACAQFRPLVLTAGTPPPAPDADCGPADVTEASQENESPGDGFVHAELVVTTDSDDEGHLVVYRSRPAPPLPPKKAKANFGAVDVASTVHAEIGTADRVTDSSHAQSNPREPPPLPPRTRVPPPLPPKKTKTGAYVGPLVLLNDARATAQSLPVKKYRATAKPGVLTPSACVSASPPQPETPTQTPASASDKFDWPPLGVNGLDLQCSWPPAPVFCAEGDLAPQASTSAAGSAHSSVSSEVSLPVASAASSSDEQETFGGDDVFAMPEVAGQYDDYTCLPLGPSRPLTRPPVGDSPEPQTPFLTSLATSLAPPRALTPRCSLTPGRLQLHAAPTSMREVPPIPPKQKDLQAAHDRQQAQDRRAAATSAPSGVVLRSALKDDRPAAVTATASSHSLFEQMTHWKSVASLSPDPLSMPTAEAKHEEPTAWSRLKNRLSVRRKKSVGGPERGASPPLAVAESTPQSPEAAADAAAEAAAEAIRQRIIAGDCTEEDQALLLDLMLTTAANCSAKAQDALAADILRLLRTFDADMARFCANSGFDPITSARMVQYNYRTRTENVFELNTFLQRFIRETTGTPLVVVEHMRQGAETVAKSVRERMIMKALEQSRQLL